jgi:phage tail P2-like protein
MSKTVNNVTLLELLPKNLRNDPDIIVASQAVDMEFQALAGAIKNCLTIADVDNASAEVVDHLAAEMDVDYYDDSLPLTTRRSLVKNGYLVKYQNGTKYAVNKVLKAFYSNPELIEWFESNGTAFYFTIIVNGEHISSAVEVLAAIEKAKNARSWLEKLMFIPDVQSFSLYLGTACHQITKYNLTQTTTGQTTYVCMPGTLLKLS